MVNFRKRLGGRQIRRVIDPVEIYDALDRASDKGPLRPAQEDVLKRWNSDYSDVTDVILKMHTGQGKTLVGLLMLQSKLNADKGPALFLCANNFLVKQTCDQAKQFGFSVCTADQGLPSDFTDGKSILVTTVQKLFNGLTQFGLRNKSQEVGAIIIDDAHACVDLIREAFIICLSNKAAAYSEICDLFDNELEEQGVGTFADIRNKKYDAMLPVPYWVWANRVSEVAKILSRNSDSKAVKFAWPLLKDILKWCQCVISGKSLEISPYLPPLDLFKSYYNASCRVFMSATVADDSFLVKGLGLAPEIISNPLTYEKDKWSGEKMMLMPSLIHESLDRAKIVSMLARPKDDRDYGVAVLVPSFKYAKNWESHGATVVDIETIDSAIEGLRNDSYENVIVIANRYDGIDLPDNSCRCLIFDSEPYSESLVDLYLESCRASSVTTAIRKSRTIEQGLGRSVRGERDFSVILIIGPGLVKYVQSKLTRGYLSNQTQLQIQIGFDIAKMAQEDLRDGSDPFVVFERIMDQCLKRDAEWKEFYADNMKAVEAEKFSKVGLDLFSRELKAEQLHQNGDSSEAVDELQALINECELNDEECGWYLQEMARYSLSFDALKSNELQIEAHRKNHALLKPSSGMKIDKMVVISHKRVERSIKWITNCESYEQLRVSIDDILGNLTFGVKANKFEESFCQLGIFLGFCSERPDREWKAGPDNLWGLRENEYLVVECKSEVKRDRLEINADEAEQMNRASAWFDAQYKNLSCQRWIVIPTRKLIKNSAFTHEVKILTNKGLRKLVRNVRKFTEQFSQVDFNHISDVHVQKLMDASKLSVEDICSEYTEAVIRQ